MKKRKILHTIIITFCLLFFGQPTYAQTESEKYFPETGHNITGEFYDFFMDNEYAEIVFGYPITEMFFDPVSGHWVQYFQNARFEFFPNNPLGYQIKLTRLGEILYEPGLAIDLSSYTSNCAMEPGWAHMVCFSFLEFYRSYNGSSMLGKPISGFEFVRGRYVQQFEYAQLVWNPDHPEGARVSLAPLGRLYLYKMEDFSRLPPIRSDQYSMLISKLQIRCFTQLAIVPRSKTQTAYVTIYDQNSAPVIGAFVEISITFPNGETKTLPVVATDQDGLAKVNFSVDTELIGLAELNISAVYGTIKQDAVTSFRVGY